MSDGNTLRGKDLLDVLDSSRNPLKLAAIRNEALVYIRDNSEKLPKGKHQACKDYLDNFNSSKRMSDQLRDLAIWVDEMNVYIQKSVNIGRDKE